MGGQLSIKKKLFLFLFVFAPELTSDRRPVRTCACAPPELLTREGRSAAGVVYNYSVSATVD